MYRYAIIGFGGLGKKHLSNLSLLQKERDDFRLCAICGIGPVKSMTENIKINLGDVDISLVDFSNCNFYEDYKELINKEKPDFIISCLPTYLHEEVAVYSLEHGADVFSEKPMALSMESCRNMISTAKKHNRKLMIGQCLRFSPAYCKLKEYIDNKTFGRVCRAEFTRYSQKPLWTANNWILEHNLSGGCPLDMHVHDVDLINWYFGKPISVCSAMSGKNSEYEGIFTQYYYDDFMVMANADWSMTQTFPFEAKCLVNFEEATVVIYKNKVMVYKDNESYEEKISNEDYFAVEMRAFLSYVIDGINPSNISVESVMKTMEIVMNEISSAKKYITEN